MFLYLLTKGMNMVINRITLRKKDQRFRDIALLDNTGY